MRNIHRDIESQPQNTEGVLGIRRIFSLVDMITNTKFSNCSDVFKIDVVGQ